MEDLKFEKVSQSPILQDTTLLITEGIYSAGTYQALVEELKTYAESKGFMLADVQPVKVTLRQIFNPQAPQEAVKEESTEKE